MNIVQTDVLNKISHFTLIFFVCPTDSSSKFTIMYQDGIKRKYKRGSHCVWFLLDEEVGPKTLFPV